MVLFPLALEKWIIIKLPSIISYSQEVINLLIHNDKLNIHFLNRGNCRIRKSSIYNFREGNKVAHVLENLAKTSNTNEVCVVFVAPPALVLICLAEDVK